MERARDANGRRAKAETRRIGEGTWGLMIPRDGGADPHEYTILAQVWEPIMAAHRGLLVRARVHRLLSGSPDAPPRNGAIVSTETRTMGRID
jgi:hypothetical protein